MLAYREIIEKTDDISKITTFLKKHLNQKLEVIIVSLKNETVRKNKSLGGILKKYKNPEMIKYEHLAWEKAIEEKYGNHFTAEEEEVARLLEFRKKKLSGYYDN